MKAEEAVGLDKAQFRQWVRETSSDELQRVFHCCSMHSNSEKWELTKLELDGRGQRLNVRIGIIAAVAAIVAALASVWVVFLRK
jgi:hypothetical protein